LSQLIQVVEGAISPVQEMVEIDKKGDKKTDRNQFIGSKV